MNEEVEPPDQSDFPKMHLAVLDGNNKPIEDSTYKYDPTVPSLRIAFVNPYTTKEFNDDLQFVIEVEGKTEDSRDAEFIEGGSIGCDNNKRVSGRLLESQAAVVLKINDNASRLRVWAGWATGHNAVRLVPDLILEPGEPGTAAAVAETIEEEVEELEEEIRELEFQNTPKEKELREEEMEKLEKILGKDTQTEVPERKREEDKLSKLIQGEDTTEKKQDDAPSNAEEEAPQKSHREKDEEYLLKLLGDDTPEEKKTNTESIADEVAEMSRVQKEEVLMDDLEKELREEEFQNIPKEKLQREQEEEKLEKLLEGDDGDPEPKNERALLNNEGATNTAEKSGLQRKRKNALQKNPGDAADGLIDPNKRGKDLGLEIKRKDRERGRQGGDEDAESPSATNKSIAQKLRDKQLDLEAAGGNNKNQDRRKHLHKLVDHAVDQQRRQIRDIPETVEIYDDATDDDLPEVDPDEADHRPRAAVRGSIRKPDDGDSSSSFSGGGELRLVLDSSRHVVACAFFAAAMGLFYGIYGRKRGKGRRDL
eukprot:CAMPEP_0197186328 /NCGR_PEP_ID=MMETSP1423-20130617/13711_1 /TAXON_ID=476441 /ORGANISM="Pseudo-nitzschia heimii, Strain UNC1101" /LENGTH=536 /DNA_ID=CAMNT_0042637605 /DNA_START=359 /DNA_END=1969 /DNA_ORIENTATION=-